MASSCSICLCTTADSADKEWCVLSKCGHTFHEACLSQACAQNPRCPNCRESIWLNQSDRDRSVLRRNLVLPIRLDISGQDDGAPSQLSLSPASDRLKRQLAAAQSQCRNLEDALELREATARQQLQQMQLTISQSEQVLQSTQDKLAAAREELHGQKRQFTAQLKDERSKRHTAESLAERLQAAVDKHELLSNTGLSRSELQRMALRHGQAAQQASSFADAMAQRNEMNAKLLSNMDREATKAEQQRRRSEQQLAEKDGTIQQLQAQLKAAEQEARRAAQSQRQTDACAASAAAAGAAAAGPTPSRAQPSKASGAAAEAAAQQAADDDWLELDDEEAAVKTPAPRQPLQPRPPATPAPGPSFLQGGGGPASSFLGALAPRGLAEPSFMRSGACTSTSGDFIREGPDGRGGRIKVLVPSTQTWAGAAQQKRVRVAPPPVPAIKRRKGASSRGGAAITIEHFFDVAEQDAGRGEEDKAAQRRGR